MLVSGEEDCLIGDGLLIYPMAEFVDFPHVYLFLLQHECIPSARQNLEEELCLHGPVTYQVTVQEQKGRARTSAGDAVTYFLNWTSLSPGYWRKVPDLYTVKSGKAIWWEL